MFWGPQQQPQAGGCPPFVFPCARSSTFHMHMRIIVINNNKLDVMLEFVQAEEAERFLPISLQ